MQNELKPCPFCGGKAEMLHWRASVNGKTIYPYRVRCIECKTCVGSSSLKYITLTEEDAREKWNRRVDNAE
jgi:Lar family restriction alleviation protein